MSLTKEDLVNSIQHHLGFSKRKSTDVFESLFEIMKSTLEKEEDILISGFGKFCVKDKNERRGRNPQTGYDMILGSRRVVVFKWSGILKDKINDAE